MAGGWGGKIEEGDRRDRLFICNGLEIAYYAYFCNLVLDTWGAAINVFFCREIKQKALELSHSVKKYNVYYNPVKRVHYIYLNISRYILEI